MTILDYIDKNPGWTLLFLLVVVYGVEQTAKALRKPKVKPKRR